MGVHVTSVRQLGNDALEVVGHVDGLVDEEGRLVELHVRGWVSAMESHYPPEAYGVDGHRLEGAEPRPMTDDERMAYWSGLLVEASGPVAPPASRVLFEAPAPPQPPSPEPPAA